MGVRIREKRGKLYLDIYFNGVRRWEALHLSVTGDKLQNKEVMRLAEVCRSKREVQMVSGEWNMQDPLARNKSLFSFLKGYAAEKPRRHSVNFLLNHLKEYPGGGVVLVSQVNRKWLSGFQAYLAGEGLAPATVNLYISALGKALRKAVQENMIAHNPQEGFQALRVPETDRTVLTFEEITRMSQIDFRGDMGLEIKRAFLFAAFTGLRISDIKTLTWGDIEHIGDRVQINKMQKKTLRRVVTPLNVTAWKIINDGTIHDRGAPVFPRLSRIATGLNSYLIAWADRAKLGRRIGWHTARRTFATLSLEYGADINTVSKLLGHTTVQTAAIYAQATDKLRARAVNALPELPMEQRGP
jgi:integrase